ncbi:hypothetical protein [Streptomyces sp. NBC_01506]|uniref:hypothetical protein n=1 Tax=Streptomyces sp. NBC_01506 TaxID=2903887 RepID=UPI0038673073
MRTATDSALVPFITRAAARLCPHLNAGPMVFLTTTFPLYGVHGTVYGLGVDGVKVVAQPDGPPPYGHQNMTTFLTSQMIRRLKSFTVVDLDELLKELAAHAA